MSELELERLSKENFEDFFSLIVELAEFEKLDPPDDDAKKRLSVDFQGENPKFNGYVGYFNGKPATYLIYFFTYSSFLAKPTLYVEDIYISNDFRRSGFGTKIFKFCAEIAKVKGCGRMEWAVLTWNEPAIKFYEKLGAKRLNDWYSYRMTENEFLELTCKD